MRIAPASLLALALALSLALGEAPAAAQEPAGASAAPGSAATTPRLSLRHDLLVDGVAVGVMTASLVTWTAVRSDVDLGACVICDGGEPGGQNVLDGAFRDALRRRDGSAAATAGDVVSYAGGPLLGAAMIVGVAAADRRLDEAPLNGLLVVEASLAAALASEGLSAVLRRERPAVHALQGEARTAALTERDALASFPGAQTASIMAVTASTATVATLRGYRLAPLVWLVGSMAALASSYLRVAADQHYATDEVAGAMVGLVVGAGVPLLFHRRASERPSAATGWLRSATATSSAVPGGRVFGLGWAF
jgi:membrane-associated phospholipid phosphatase